MYYNEKHEYTLEGEKLPSVSQILRFMSREVYEDVNQYSVDNAAKRGSAVHEACELLDKYKMVECDDEYVPYIEGYIKFLREYSVEWSEIEKQYYHAERMYAGTIDRYGMAGGKKSLVDIKTTCTVHKTLVKAQINAYNDMRISQGLDDAEKLYCVQLKNDGNYRLYEVAKDMTEFDACYALHTALSKKHKRGVIE